MATIELANFVNLQGIPLLETGIEYPASTGPFTATSEMLAEAVLSQDDPHVPPPRIKIAHADNPVNADFQQLLQETNEGLDDDAAYPSLGTIRNMEVINYGQILVGDLYGIPEWFAHIMATAYPARSIEGGAWRNEANDKDYMFCLSALSLLGVVWPGCTSLADLQELFSVEGPKISVIEMPRPKGSNTLMNAAKARMKGGSSMPVVAQVNVGDIRRAFYDDFAQGDRFWWWDREFLIDPNELIVEDPDEGQLYRLPFTTSGSDGPDSVTFGDPAPVKIEYVPDKNAENKSVEASVLIGPQLEGAGMVLAVNSTPPRANERQNRRDTVPARRVALSVDVPALRERLGLSEEQLPDDATDEQINEALAGPVAGSGPDSGVTDNNSPEAPEPGTPESGAPLPGEPSEGGNMRGNTSPAPELSGAPQESEDGTVRVDGAVWASMVNRHNEEVKKDRLNTVNAAIKAGKIPPSRREHWLSLMETDEEGTRQTLDQLEAGVVPVGETTGTEGDPSDEIQSGSSYPTEWLTAAERARIEAASAGAPATRIVAEAR